MSDVNTSVSSEGSISISMDDKSIEQDNETGIESIPSEGRVQLSAGERDDEAEGDEDITLGEDTEGSDDEGDEGGNEPPEDLGEFDPEDTEKWDAQYKNEDGKLNEQALSDEFWANADGDVPGSLNEGTYAYLENMGVSREMAKNVEAALVTQQDAATNKNAKRDDPLFALAGTIAGDPAKGPEVLSEALKWGKEGGYTEAQQKRFNAVLKGSDEDARMEAVELLLTRHAAQNGTATQKPRLPKRDATKGRGAPAGTGLKKFANKEEAREAKRAAGTDQVARQLVAKRMALGYGS